MPAPPRRTSLVLVARAAMVAVCIASCGEPSAATPTNDARGAAPIAARRVAATEEVATEAPPAQPTSTLLPPLPELDEKGRAALAVLTDDDSDAIARYRATLELVAAGDAGIVAVARALDSDPFSRSLAAALRAHGSRAVPVLIGMIDRAATPAEWDRATYALDETYVSWAHSPLAADVAAAHLRAAARIGDNPVEASGALIRGLYHPLAGDPSASLLVFAALPAKSGSTLWFASDDFELRAEDEASARIALRWLDDNTLASTAIRALGSAVSLPRDVVDGLLAVVADPQSPIRPRALLALAQRAGHDDLVADRVRTILAAGTADDRTRILRRWLTPDETNGSVSFPHDDETLRVVAALLSHEDAGVRSEARGLVDELIGSTPFPRWDEDAMLARIAALAPEPLASELRDEMAARRAREEEAPAADELAVGQADAAEAGAGDGDGTDGEAPRRDALSMLSDADAAVRLATVAALPTGEEPIHPDVAARLRAIAADDPHPSPRAAAAAVLVCHGAADEGLLALIDSALRVPPRGLDSFGGSELIVRAVRSRGPDAARFADALEFAIGRSRDEFEQHALIETIEQIGPAGRGAVPALRSALIDGLPVETCCIALRNEIRIAAVKALGAIGRDAAPAVIDLRRVERDPVVAEHVKVAIAQIEGAGR